MLVLIILIGVFPGPFLDRTRASVAAVIERVETHMVGPEEGEVSETSSAALGGSDPVPRGGAQPQILPLTREAASSGGGE